MTKSLKHLVKFNDSSVKNHIEFCHDTMVEYIELQYHDDLTLNDVEVVYYQDSINENLRKNLEKLGVKMQKVGF